MRHVTVAVLVLLAFACTDRELEREEPGVRVDAGTRVEPIDTPSGDGASAPSLSATDAGVVMSWLEPVSGTDRVAVRVAEYRDGRWSPASNVVERNDLFVNWADFPSVVGDANGTLFAHWLQKSGPGTYAYDVRMSVSKDRGKTWSAPFLLNRDGTKTEHGFATLAPLPGGGVGATWLDGRNMKPGAHEHDAGEMTLRYATVDAAGSIGEDVELDSRACECCTTGMAMAGAAPVIVYRDRTAGEIRDISYVTKGSEGWSAPRTLHPDGWKIDGCPVNGPQIDAIGTRAAAAWFTAAGELGRVYVTFSGDGGGTFAPPLRVDDGNPAGRVDIVMLDEETALVAWLEQTPAGAEIRARRVRRDGDAIASVKIADSSTARAAGFPRLARVGSEVWFAWTDQTATTKRIRLARRRF